VRLLRHQATRALLAQAMEQGVVFMPGEAFFPDGSDQAHLRLNYSHATPEQMERGLALLSRLLRQGDATRSDKPMSGIDREPHGHG
jgi:2-aminoadipate transaminase